MKNFKGSFILLITAIIWGTSFVSQKLGMNYIEPFTFGAARFLIATVALFPIILIFESLNKRKKIVQREDENKLKFKTKDLIKGGVLCGFAIFFGASAQQWGLVYTTAGKAGFITALYIVIVPLFGMFMRKSLKSRTWFGVALAVVGLYFLTIQKDLSIGKGDAIVLVGTIFWALQIIFVEFYVGKTDSLKLSSVQFFTAGILSAIAAILFENPNMKDIIACASPILYTAIIVVGLAYTLQIIGQKYISSAVAAIILSTEALFAVISGGVFLGESMSSRELLGCFLMLIAVIITQIEPEEVLEVQSIFQEN